MFNVIWSVVLWFGDQETLFYGCLATLFFLLSFVGEYRTWVVSVAMTGLAFLYYGFSTVLYMYMGQYLQSSETTMIKVGLVGDCIFFLSYAAVTARVKHWWCFLACAMYGTAVILDTLKIKDVVDWYTYSSISNRCFVVLLFSTSFPGTATIARNLWRTLLAFANFVKRYFPRFIMRYKAEV